MKLIKPKAKKQPKKDAEEVIFFHPDATPAPSILLPSPPDITDIDAEEEMKPDPPKIIKQPKTPTAQQEATAVKPPLAFSHPIVKSLCQNKATGMKLGSETHLPTEGGPPITDGEKLQATTEAESASQITVAPIKREKTTANSLCKSTNCSGIIKLSV